MAPVLGRCTGRVGGSQLATKGLQFLMQTPIPTPSPTLVWLTVHLYPAKFYLGKPAVFKPLPWSLFFPPNKAHIKKGKCYNSPTHSDGKCHRRQTDCNLRQGVVRGVVTLLKSMSTYDQG